MEDNLMTPDEVQQLLASSEQQESIKIHDVPITIYLASGRRFVVPNVGGWCYVPLGIFATGYFADEQFPGPAAERDITVPASQISYIDHDFDALERYHAEKEEARASDPGTGGSGE